MLPGESALCCQSKPTLCQVDNQSLHCIKVTVKASIVSRFITFYFMFMCECLHEYMCTLCAGVCRGQRRALGFLELKLQAVLNMGVHSDV